MNAEAIQFIGPLRVDLLTPPECAALNGSSGRPLSLQLYRFDQPFVIIHPKFGRLEIPKDYITDFGSVPPLARPYISNENACGNPGFAAHDFAYEGMLSREDADQLLYDCLLACGVRSTQAWIVWKMVRLFGASHYQRDL